VKNLRLRVHISV